MSSVHNPRHPLLAIAVAILVVVLAGLGVAVAAVDNTRPLVGW